MPPPTTAENNKLVNTQLKKPLIPENRRDIGTTGDDLLNLHQGAKKDVKTTKINPVAPTGLVPPPKTCDNTPDLCK